MQLYTIGKGHVHQFIWEITFNKCTYKWQVLNASGNNKEMVFLMFLYNTYCVDRHTY